MKIKTTVATLSVLSVLSFGAFAADTINAEQAQSRQAIGTVSVGAIGTSPMDMHEMLNKKSGRTGCVILSHHRSAQWRPLARYRRTLQINPRRISSYDLPLTSRSGAFLSLAHVETQLPFQLLLRFIKQ